MLNQVNAKLAQYGLFSSQWQIMKLLMQEGAMTPAEIAQRQQVEKPSITKILQRLGEMEYVESTPGQDKREKWIRLTSSGEAVCRDVMEQLASLYEDLLKGSSKEEVEIAISVLARAHQNLTS
ncbi:MarR family winged helix-turn-helix transcriptional regulator [Sporosarcina koreensis]|uniref:MarR family winged helix-turn-helix transcriptional regulator n=1 Tax=Sporosarcina koreensis TaxID=334735 RepID=A0ABW0TRY4_9BACL